jgi:hypothetical protein
VQKHHVQYKRGTFDALRGGKKKKKKKKKGQATSQGLPWIKSCIINKIPVVKYMETNNPQTYIENELVYYLQGASFR